MNIDQLHSGLQDLSKNLQQSMNEKWKRDLPFEELLHDRWERARRLGFGEKTSIYSNAYVFGKVKVGASTWIGPYTLLDGEGGLEIGDFCSISAAVQIYTHDTVKWAVTGGKAAYEYAPVKIENRVFIGPQSVIRKGVTIGEGSVVGAMSFVTTSIPPRSIAVGSPAKVVGEVITTAAGEVEFKYF